MSNEKDILEDIASLNIIIPKLDEIVILVAEIGKRKKPHLVPILMLMADAAAAWRDRLHDVRENLKDQTKKVKLV